MVPKGNVVLSVDEPRQQEIKLGRSGDCLSPSSSTDDAAVDSFTSNIAVNEQQANTFVYIHGMSQE
jgi:hypothetical protein